MAQAEPVKRFRNWCVNHAKLISRDFDLKFPGLLYAYSSTRCNRSPPNSRLLITGFCLLEKVMKPRMPKIGRDWERSEGLELGGTCFRYDGNVSECEVPDRALRGNFRLLLHEVRSRAVAPNTQVVMAVTTHGALQWLVGATRAAR